MDKESLIKFLENMLDQAILHGGDFGGPYFSNLEGLETSITNFMEALDLKDKYIIEWVNKDEYPRFIKKEDFLREE